MAVHGVSREVLPQVDVIVYIGTAEGYAQLPYVARLDGADEDAWLSAGWEPADGDEG